MSEIDHDVLEFWEQPYCLERQIKPMDIIKFKITGGFSHISFYITTSKPEMLTHKQRGLLTSSTEDRLTLERKHCKYVGHIRTLKHFTVVYKPTGELQISTSTMNVITSLEKFQNEKGVWLVFMSNFADVSIMEFDTLQTTDLKRSMSLHVPNSCNDDIISVSVASCQTEDYVQMVDNATQVDNNSLEVVSQMETKQLNGNEKELQQKIYHLEKLNKELELNIRKLMKALHNKVENHVFEEKIQDLSKRLDETLGNPSKQHREEKWKEIIRQNYSQIVDNIEALEIAQYMFQHKVISLNTFDRIRQIRTTADASHEILTVILRKPVSDVLFCDCLKKTDHQHVYDGFFPSES